MYFWLLVRVASVQTPLHPQRLQKRHCVKYRNHHSAARFSTFPKPHEVEPAYLLKGFDVGVTGCVRAASHAIPKMLEAGTTPERNLLFAKALLRERAASRLHRQSRFAVTLPKDSQF